MAQYFAEIDQNNVVKRVIVADQNFIDSGVVGDPKNWVETSMDGSFRKNYAGIGYTYDDKLDAFIAPKPTENAVLDETYCKYKIPVKDAISMGVIKDSPEITDKKEMFIDNATVTQILSANLITE